MAVGSNRRAVPSGTGMRLRSPAGKLVRAGLVVLMPAALQDKEGRTAERLEPPLATPGPLRDRQGI